MVTQPVYWMLLTTTVTASTLSLPATSLAQSPQRFPVPSHAEQAKEMDLVREIYESDYKGAATDEERAALAKRMLQQAGQLQRGLASHFVLLRAAGDIAVQAGDAELAYKGIAQMGDYDVDIVKMKLDVLTKAARSTSSPKACQAIARFAQDLLEECIAADRFEHVDDLCEVAMDAARATRDRDLIKQVVARTRRGREVAEVYEQVKKARATLEIAPSDPDANLVVGKYLCFVKSDWEKGISLLALGNDEQLKALAIAELRGVSDANEQASVGDRWWDLGEKEEAAKQRASYWYKKALPWLSGLAKDKVALRLGSNAGNDNVASVRDIVGTYKVSWTNQDGHTNQPGHTGAITLRLENGFRWAVTHPVETDNGSWQMHGNEVDLTYADKNKGTAQLQFHDGTHFRGVHRFPDGRLVKWVGTRSE